MMKVINLIDELRKNWPAGACSWYIEIEDYSGKCGRCGWSMEDHEYLHHMDDDEERDDDVHHG